MARTAIPVDQKILEQALSQVEANGALSSESELWKRLSEKYNVMRGANPLITLSVAMLRTKELKLPKKTKSREEKNAEKLVIPKKREADAPKERPTSTRPDSLTIPRIAIPSGEPPSALKDLEDKTLEVWVNQMCAHATKIGVIYTSEALAYWARHYNKSKDSIEFTFSDIHDLEERIAIIMRGESNEQL